MKKEHYARDDHFDVWLPDLAPSAALLSYAHGTPLTPARWAAFARRDRAEMTKPEARRLLSLLAALSAQTNLPVGCYCEDESRCHRSLLRQLLVERGATVS